MSEAECMECNQYDFGKSQGNKQIESLKSKLTAERKKVGVLREGIDEFRIHYEQTKGKPKTAAILWKALSETAGGK